MWLGDQQLEDMNEKLIVAFSARTDLHNSVTLSHPFVTVTPTTGGKSEFEKLNLRLHGSSKKRKYDLSEQVVPPHAPPRALAFKPPFVDRGKVSHALAILNEYTSN